MNYLAGAYLRLSVEDENKNNESISITNQKEFIKEYALKHNIEIYDYYIDDGFSGGNFNRPNFKRLINDIENGPINCVITKDMSRLGREFIETGTYIFKYFPEHSIRYISILENYDSLNPNGTEDIIPFKAVINDMYLKDISKKIKSIRHEKMRKGEFVSGTVPYGYKRSPNNNKELIIDEYAADIVKKIFEMKDQGLSNNKIAQNLTNKGILPPDVYRGKKLKKITSTTNLWKPCTIKHILNNENYIGTLIQGKYERVNLKSQKKRLLPKNKWEIKENALPIIIPYELFKRINNSQNKVDIRHRKYDYLLKGLVTCSECNKTMSLRRIKRKSSSFITPIYICRTYASYGSKLCTMHYYKEEKLNEYVLNTLKYILSNHTNISKLEEKYQKILMKSDVLNNYQISLKKHNQKIITLDKALSELYKDKAKNILSKEDFSIIKTNLGNEKKECEIEITKIKNLITNYTSILENERQKRKIITNFINLSHPSKKLLQIFIKKIEINEKKQIKIFLNFNIKENCHA